MICVDCLVREGTVTFGLGDKRCQKCADIFHNMNYYNRVYKENKGHKCEDCGEVYCGPYACPHCCDHEPDADEGYHCLNCGTDCSEGVMSAAYDRAKDIRKYGAS